MQFRVSEWQVPMQYFALQHKGEQMSLLFTGLADGYGNDCENTPLK